MLEVIHTSAAPEPVGPYSQGLLDGKILFCSGQAGIDPSTGSLVEGGVAAEAAQVLANLSAVLASSGFSLRDVAKTTVFLTQMTDFIAVNDVYARYFGDHRPARTTVAVAALPVQALVEIEAIAIREPD